MAITALDPCRNVPCENGGTCMNLGIDYECVCPDGYTGKDCQIGEISKHKCSIFCMYYIFSFIYFFQLFIYLFNYLFIYLFIYLLYI